MDDKSQYSFRPWREVNGTRVRLSDAGWKKPLKWNRQASCGMSGCNNAATCDGEIGPLCDSHCKHVGRYHPAATPSDKCVAVERPRVFCASLADVFEDWQGPILDHRGRAFMHVINGIKPAPSIEVANAWVEQTGCRFVTMDDLRRDLFRLIDATPNLTWILSEGSCLRSGRSICKSAKYRSPANETNPSRGTRAARRRATPPA